MGKIFYDGSSNWSRDPKKFEQVFGFKPPEPRSAEEVLRDDAINEFFDNMRNRFGMIALEVFTEAATEVGSSDARKMHSEFHIIGVRTCPAYVLAFCERALVDDPVLRQKLRQKYGRIP
jgi:hypothetical protein